MDTPAPAAPVTPPVTPVVPEVVTPAAPAPAPIVLERAKISKRDIFIGLGIIAAFVVFAVWVGQNRKEKNG